MAAMMAKKFPRDKHRNHRPAAPASLWDEERKGIAVWQVLKKPLAAA
jgi:hypothetical protein